MILMNFLIQLKKVESSDNKLLSSINSFVAKRIGLAYLGTLNWMGNEKFEVLSIVNYVDSNFPKTFITDGRLISFEDHAKKLEKN